MNRQTIPSQDLINCKICGAHSRPHAKHRRICIPCAMRKQVEYTRKYRSKVRASTVNRTCRTCGQSFLPVNGRTWKCPACLAAYMLDYSRKRKVKNAEAQRRYRVAKGDEYRRYTLQRRRDKIAGMTPEELAAFRKKESDKTKRLSAIIKNDVFVAYGGWRCACCGETERSFLTIDHMQNNGSKLRRLGIHGHSTDFYRWLKKCGFPSGFQVLCMNCQFGKRMNKGVCPHQVRCNDYPEREYGQVAGSAVPLQ